MMYYFKLVLQGTITSIEAKSVDIASPGFVTATKEEYDTFLASLPPPEPPLACPEFSTSPPGQAPPARLDNIEEFLYEVTAFCKAKFG